MSVSAKLNEDLNAPRLARGTIFAIFGILCENQTEQQARKPFHWYRFLTRFVSENVNLKGTSTEPRTIPLNQEYHFSIFEVPRVGAINIFEGPHSHPQRAPRTTCLRQRGHPGAPNQNFSPPLAPESRVLPCYHYLTISCEAQLSAHCNNPAGGVTM